MSASGWTEKNIKRTTVWHDAGSGLGKEAILVMTTVLSAQSDNSSFSDVRARSGEQLIAAAKTGRKDPFGELCERHTKRSSASPIGSARLIIAKLSLAFWVRAVPGYSRSACIFDNKY
jgi:hypothetical protein